MIELLLTCSLLSSVSFELDSIQDIKRVSQQCEVIEEVQEWIPLVNKYFKSEDEALALTVLFCESSGNPKAHGHNRNGTIDKGLFQFNSKTEKWLEEDIYNKELDMYDPETNVKAARWLSLNSGWHHWNSSYHCWSDYVRDNENERNK